MAHSCLSNASLGVIARQRVRAKRGPMTGSGGDDSASRSIFVLDIDILVLYFTQHPRSLRDVLEANLNVNGERRLRSWLATTIPGGLGDASWRKIDAEGSILNPSRRPQGSRPGRIKGERGAKVEARAEKTPQWSAVRRGRPRKILRGRSPCLIGTVLYPRPTALCSLLWE